MKQNNCDSYLQFNYVRLKKGLLTPLQKDWIELRKAEIVFKQHLDQKSDFPDFFKQGDIESYIVILREHLFNMFDFYLNIYAR